MCQPTNLAATGPFRVDYCSCGSIHLHIGPTMLRLDPDCLRPLTEALELAGSRLPALQRIDGPRPPNERPDSN